MKNIIISLFDHTGSWSLPYKKAGYKVITVDIKDGIDILSWDYKTIDKTAVAGILLAPPCTDFTVSGAQYWPAKDVDGTTEYSISLVKKGLEIVSYFNPTFWALENPVGRISKLIPELGKPWYFQPYEFGDPWTKKTGLWGKFEQPEPCITIPIQWAEQGSWSQLLGGKSAKTKELRSITPAGFANAFFEANNPAGLSTGEEHLYLFGRCKYGQWSCAFAVSHQMCSICDGCDNYEPDDFADQFETEEQLMMAIFDKGKGIQKHVNPKPFFSL